MEADIYDNVTKSCEWGEVSLMYTVFIVLLNSYVSGAGAGPADPAAAGPIIHKTNYFKNLC